MNDPYYLSFAAYPGGAVSWDLAPFVVWGKSFSDLNPLPQNWQWNRIAYMTKPGVDSVMIPRYEITESSKHASKNDAGWAISSKSGRIKFPTTGDFGITSRIGGNWLCEGGTVRDEGKYWKATCTYLHSGDRFSWDLDLYD